MSQAPELVRTKEAVAARRDKVQVMLYRGFSIRQMKGKLHVNEKTIDNDLDHIRNRASGWYRHNKNRQQRARSMLFFRLEGLKDLLREAWHNYEKAEKQTFQKDRWWNNILKAQQAITDLEGLTGVANSTLEIERDMEEVLEKIDQVKRLAGTSRAIIETAR